MDAFTGTEPEWIYRLFFAMEAQEETYWCWAATAVSTARFLLGDSRSQCAVANEVLTRDDCCAEGNSVACNVTSSLPPALQAVRTFVRMVPRRLSHAELTNELASGRPVASRIEWPDGGGHFVILGGIATDHRLEVADPAYGSAVEPYASFASDYLQLGGRWTHSYLLVDPRAADRIDPALRKVASLLMLPTLQLPFPRSLGSATVGSVDVPVYSARVDELAADGQLAPQLVGRESFPDDATDVVRAYPEGGQAPSLRIPLYAESLQRVVSDLRNSGRRLPELRLFKVPSLYITAVWVHSASEDLFFPLDPAPRYLQAGREYELRQFEFILRDHASSRMRDIERERTMTYGFSERENRDDGRDRRDPDDRDR